MANDLLEISHVLNPILETLSLFRGQSGVDCFSGDLSGPLVIWSVKHRGIGLAPARWVTAAVIAESNASLKDQADVRNLGQQCVMTLFEKLKNLTIFVAIHTESIYTSGMNCKQFSSDHEVFFRFLVSTGLMTSTRAFHGETSHTMTSEVHP